jgi:hypothetical protein
MTDNTMAKKKKKIIYKTLHKKTEDWAFWNPQNTGLNAVASEG